MKNLDYSVVARVRLTVGVLLLLVLVSCTGSRNGLQDVAASILSQTGIVSHDEARAIFRAGEAIGKASSPLTPEQEYYLGRAVAATILSRYPMLPDTASNRNLQRYVTNVGHVVARSSHMPETFGGYFFVVLDSDEVNAVSAPGGFVFVSKGFLAVLRSEDELAAVLAHEVAHVTLRHGVGALSQAELSDALLMLGKEAASARAGAEVGLLTDTFGDMATDVADTLLTKGYSRSQEYEADKYASAILLASGYEPAALPGVLAILEKTMSQNDEAASGWFSTHPEASDRADELGVAQLTPRSESSFSPGEKMRQKRFQSAMRALNL